MESWMEYGGIPARKHVPIMGYVTKSIRGAARIARGVKHKERTV